MMQHFKRGEKVKANTLSSFTETGIYEFENNFF